MTRIFDARYRRTLDVISAEAKAGEQIEAWTFDDRASRRAAEDHLSQRGVNARIRSAYKPLLHAFLEDIDLTGVTGIRVYYPVEAQSLKHRFRLEAYPLAGLVGLRDFAFHPNPGPGAKLDYRVELSRGGAVETVEVFAPNSVQTDVTGRRSLSPTAWIRRNGELLGQALCSDYQQMFQQAMAAVAQHDWPREMPYFEELNIKVAFPAGDEPLGIGKEVISLREALHEEIYFSLLAFFTAKAGLAAGSRGARPGQIVPEILQSNGEISISIECRSFTDVKWAAEPQSLERATMPLDPQQISQELRALGGQAFSARSRAGRPVEARYIVGGDAPVMISGGQHANETTGIVGALRAARHLRGRPAAHFTISPLENPDGYALHHRLCMDNPQHMHHAARYTAFGDDLEYRDAETGIDLNEKEIRRKAQALSGAMLHLNLHGYPSHEWTRPLSGYVPHGFEMWTLPKGFFLIATHSKAAAGQVKHLLDRITRHLSNLPGLLAFNRRQIELYEMHAGPTQFQIINSFPCLISEEEGQAGPISLITEYPDETIYGDDFIAGHDAQMQTVLAAYDAWQEINRPA